MSQKLGQKVSVQGNLRKVNTPASMKFGQIGDLNYDLVKRGLDKAKVSVHLINVFLLELVKQYSKASDLIDYAMDKVDEFAQKGDLRFFVFFHQGYFDGMIFLGRGKGSQILLYDGILQNKVALLHEVMEFLLDRGELEIEVNGNELVVMSKTGKSLLKTSITPSYVNKKWMYF